MESIDVVKDLVPLHPERNGVVLRLLERVMADIQCFYIVESHGPHPFIEPTLRLFEDLKPTPNVWQLRTK